MRQNPDPMTSIPTIASKLTAAEVEGLTSAFAGSCNRMMVAFSTGSQASLCAKGLAVSPNGVAWPHLTELGLSIRAHLIELQKEASK